MFVFQIPSYNKTCWFTCGIGYYIRFFYENCSAKMWEEGEWGRVMEREYYDAFVEFL